MVKNCKENTKRHTNCQKGTKNQRGKKVPKNAACLDLFGIFLETYINFLCQCDSVQQAKKSVCCSDSVHTRVSEGFFQKCSAIFFRQEIVNQKLETHPLKSSIKKTSVN